MNTAPITNTQSQAAQTTAKPKDAVNGFEMLQWAIISLTDTLQDKAVMEVNSEKILIADQIKLNSENNENNFVPIPWDQTHKLIHVSDGDTGKSYTYWEKITPTSEQLQENSIANEQVEKIRAYGDGKSKVDQQLMQVATANNSSTVSSTTQATDLLSANNDALTKSAEAIARA